MNRNVVTFEGKGGKYKIKNKCKLEEIQVYQSP